MRFRRRAQRQAGRSTGTKTSRDEAREQLRAALASFLGARQIIEHDGPDGRLGPRRQIGDAKALDRPGCLAEAHETAVRAQAGERAAPGILAHRVEDRVAQGAVGEIRYTKDERKGQLLASEAFQQNCWMGVSQPGMADARAMDFVGQDRFMWGSDYPHYDCTYPGALAELDTTFEELARPELRTAILHDNPRRFLGLR